jgi:hypothetical protein
VARRGPEHFRNLISRPEYPVVLPQQSRLSIKDGSRSLMSS